MKSVKAIKDFSINGVYYDVGDDVKITRKEELVRLNELGFIEPQSAKDIQNFDK